MKYNPSMKEFLNQNRGGANPETNIPKSLDYIEDEETQENIGKIISLNAKLKDSGYTVLKTISGALANIESTPESLDKLKKIYELKKNSVNSDEEKDYFGAMAEVVDLLNQILNSEKEDSFKRILSQIVRL